MQSMLSAYVDQSQKMFMQMQEKIEDQTRNLFAGFPFPGFPGQEGKADTKPAAKK